MFRDDWDFDFREVDAVLGFHNSLAGLNDTLNAMACVYCNNGEESCPTTMSNPEFWHYVFFLKDMADATGMRIFRLEPNDFGKYIALDFCNVCDGKGWNPELQLHDAHVQLCLFCAAEGFKLYFLDSFTEKELFRDYDDYVSRHPTGPTVRDPGPVNVSGGTCLSSGCSNPKAGHHPYCTSCQAGRSAPDYGMQGTGNCVSCGGRTYSSSIHCGACR